MALDAFNGLPEPFNSIIVFRNIGYYLHNALWHLPKNSDISISMEWGRYSTDPEKSRYRQANRISGKWTTESCGEYEPCVGLATITVNGGAIPKKMYIACMWDEEVAP